MNRTSKNSRKRSEKPQDVRGIARECLGYERLLPGQEEAIRAVLGGHDALAVLPTGSGKSAIYQIASLLLGGLTLVISPLIALQQDQVESIETLDIGTAAALNSTMSAADRRVVWDQLDRGNLDFLFLAPEQFENDESLERLKAAMPSLIVIDEAHCVVEWGHDFRPDYLHLGAVIEELGHPRVLGLTATAAPLVRDEIVERLELKSPCIVAGGFDRPNIWLGVRRFDDETSKTHALLTEVADSSGAGIVYAATRRHVDEIMAELKQREIAVAGYHAGMSTADREAAQTAFMNGDVDVIVATNAFGMGIDKPDVRFVYHLDIPDSVDAYYQEIGRAGRDGDPARALLFYRPEDLALQRFFAGGGAVDAGDVEEVAEAVEDHDGPVDPSEIKNETDLSRRKVEAALTNLEDGGAVERLADGDVVEDAMPNEIESVAREAVEHEETLHRRRQSRIEMMRGYAEAHDCRRQYLLNYLGEPYEGSCGNCDLCEAGVQADGGAEPFPLQSQVRHAEWGTGTVIRYEGDTITVLFESEGYKTLDISTVLESGLLESASPVEVDT